MSTVRYCVHCGDPIPGGMRSGTRYCSRRCSQGRKLSGSSTTNRTVSFLALERQLEDRVRRVLDQRHPA